MWWDVVSEILPDTLKILLVQFYNVTDEFSLDERESCKLFEIVYDYFSFLGVITFSLHPGVIKTEFNRYLPKYIGSTLDYILTHMSKVKQLYQQNHA